MESHHDPLRKIPTKHVPEARADIGTTLKAARAKKGHTLEAVAQHTRIPKKFLAALEDNKFDEFPALAYLRGFLKSYCEYLELDFEPLWKDVTSEPSATTPAPATSSSSQPASAKALPAGDSKPAAKTQAPAAAKPAVAGAPSAAKKKREEPKMADKSSHHAPAHDSHGAHGSHGSHGAPSATGPVGPVLLALILGLLGSIGFFASTSRVPPAPKPAATPAALLAAKPPIDNALVLDFKEESFASVTIDGERKFEGKVPKGARQEWKSAKPIELKLSDPAAVSATLNGAERKLPAPDASGTIKVEAQ